MRINPCLFNYVFPVINHPDVGPKWYRPDLTVYPLNGLPGRWQEQGGWPDLMDFFGQEGAESVHLRQALQPCSADFSQVGAPAIDSHTGQFLPESVPFNVNIVDGDIVLSSKVLQNPVQYLLLGLIEGGGQPFQMHSKAIPISNDSTYKPTCVKSNKVPRIYAVEAESPVYR